MHGVKKLLEQREPLLRRQSGQRAHRAPYLAFLVLAASALREGENASTVYDYVIINRNIVTVSRHTQRRPSCAFSRICLAATCARRLVSVDEWDRDLRLLITRLNNWHAQKRVNHRRLRAVRSHHSGSALIIIPVRGVGSLTAKLYVRI